MMEIKYKNTVVRIHGNPSQDKVKEASELFMKKVLQSKKRKGENNEEVQS